MEGEPFPEFQMHLPAIIGFTEAQELFAYVDKNPSVGNNDFLLDGLDLALQYARQGETTGAIVVSGKLLLITKHVDSALQNLATLVVGYCYSQEEEWQNSSIELLFGLLSSAEEQGDVEIGRLAYLLLGKLHHKAGNHDQMEIALINSLAFLADTEQEPQPFSSEQLQTHLILLSMYEEGETFLEKAGQLQQEGQSLLSKDDNGKESLEQANVLQQGYAVSMMEASLAFYRESLQTVGRARALTSLGNLYLELERFQEAEELFFASLSFCEAKEHTEGAAGVYLGIGKLLQARSRPSDAKIMFGKSYELYDEIQHSKGKERVLQLLQTLSPQPANNN